MNTWDHGLQLFFGFVAFLLQLVALYQGPVHLLFSKQCNLRFFKKIFPTGSIFKLWSPDTLPQNYTG